MAWYPADLKRRWREARLKQLDGRQPASETAAADRPPSNVPASTSGGNPSSDPLPDAVSESTPGAEARGRTPTSVDQVRRPTGCCLCNLRRLWNPAAGQGRQQPASETEATTRPTGNVPDSTGGGSPPRDPLPDAPASESTSDAGSTIIRSPPPEPAPAPAPGADAAGPSTSAKNPGYSGILSPTCEPTWLVPD